MYKNPVNTQKDIVLFQRFDLLTYFLMIFVLLWAFVIPIGFLLYYMGKGTLTKIKGCLLIGMFILLIAFNPIFQRIAFDHLDQQRLQSMLEKAKTHGLIGKSKNDVLILFGKPRDTDSWFNATVAEGGTCCNGPYKDRTDYEVWYYSVTPFYLLTRTFEINFTDGKVNDYSETVYLD